MPVADLQKKLVSIFKKFPKQTREACLSEDAIYKDDVKVMRQVIRNKAHIW